MSKSHDPECRRLAEHFLATEPPGALHETEAKELAQVIQDAIEAWFDYRDGDSARAAVAQLEEGKA